MTYEEISIAATRSVWSAPSLPALSSNVATPKAGASSTHSNRYAPRYVRSLRKQAGLSQESLAEKADLHPVYISYSRDWLHSPDALCGIRRKCSLNRVSSLFDGAFNEVGQQRSVGRLQTGPLCRRGNAVCRRVAVKGISLPGVPLALALVEAN